MTSPPAAPPEARPESDENSASLRCVAVYRRTVRASLERVWENVLDWEHLPWLHRGEFAEVQLRDAGDWGWRARVVTTRGHELGLELLVERAASRYVSRTVEGDGAGTEIWTQLRGRAGNETDVEVEFHVPSVPADAVKAVAAAYTSLYTRLWDEDEAMMRERELRLVSRRATARTALSVAPLNLGNVETLRAKLPLRVEFAGESVWLVELNGVVLSHAAVCPHSLGPLPAAGSDEGTETVQCPWHGYRFNARTGASCDGRKLRLRASPRVEIEAGEVRLVECSTN